MIERDIDRGKSQDLSPYTQYQPRLENENPGKGRGPHAVGIGFCAAAEGQTLLIKLLRDKPAGIQSTLLTMVRSSSVSSATCPARWVP